MSVLPWLLHWPPSKRTVVIVALATACSVGTLVVFDVPVTDERPENASVESVDLTVSLNDAEEFPDGSNGSVQTCFASGTPPNSVSVLGDVVFDVPADERARSAVLRLATADETRTLSLDESGAKSVFWVFEHDGALSVNETVELRVGVRSESGLEAETTRNLTVQEDSRAYDCE